MFVKLGNTGEGESQVIGMGAKKKVCDSYRADIDGKGENLSLQFCKAEWLYGVREESSYALQC